MTESTSHLHKAQTHTYTRTHSARIHTKPFNCDAQGDKATMALLLLIGRLILRNVSH